MARNQPPAYSAVDSEDQQAMLPPAATDDQDQPATEDVEAHPTTPTGGQHHDTTVDVEAQTSTATRTQLPSNISQQIRQGPIRHFISRIADPKVKNTAAELWLYYTIWVLVVICGAVMWYCIGWTLWTIGSGIIEFFAAHIKDAGTSRTVANGTRYS